jgi:hypothetical protein
MTPLHDLHCYSCSLCSNTNRCLQGWLATVDNDGDYKPECPSAQAGVVARCSVSSRLDVLAAQNEAEHGSASPLEQHIKVFAHPHAASKQARSWRDFALVEDVERRSFLFASTVLVHLGGFGKVVPPPGLPVSH